MNKGYNILLIILFLWNFLAFIVYCVDKAKASRTPWNRTPERKLLFFAFFGGALGSMIGMEIARHKTGDDKNNPKTMFQVGVPLSYIAQFLFLYFAQHWKNVFYIIALILYVILMGLMCLGWESNHAKQNAANREAMQQARNGGSYTPREPMNFNSGSKNNSDTWR